MCTIIVLFKHNQYMQTCELIASQERLLIVLERVEAHLKSICKMIENVENVYNKDDGVQLPKHQENRQPQIEKVKIVVPCATCVRCTFAN